RSCWLIKALIGGSPAPIFWGPKQGHAGVHLHVPNCSFSSCMTDPRQLAILQYGPGWRGPNAVRSIKTARVHHAARRRGGMATSGACAAIRDAGDRLFELRVAGIRCPLADRPPAGFEPDRLR